MGTVQPPLDSGGRDEQSPNSTTGSPGGISLSPYAILKDAVQAVPAVKYALGVLGIVAAITIVGVFQMDYRVAVLGTIVTFVLMVVLVVFAKLTRAAPKRFVAPVLILMWTFLLLTVGTACLLFTSVFFKFPVDLQAWIKPTMVAPSAADLSAILAGQVPPLPDAAKPPPELGADIVARRAGASEFGRLPDGAELASEVDDYFILVRPLTDGYLYVFQLDAAGRVQWLFPANDTSPYSSGTNPVRTDSTVQVPDGPDRALYLDATEGTESVYVVLSTTSWPELESGLRNAAASRNEKRAPRRELLSSSRGVGGVRRAPATTSPGASMVLTQLDGKVYRLPAPVELLQASGHFVVVKRWFTHVARR